MPIFDLIDRQVYEVAKLRFVGLDILLFAGVPCTFGFISLRINQDNEWEGIIGSHKKY